jgi:hypothetical protein
VTRRLRYRTRRRTTQCAPSISAATATATQISGLPSDSVRASDPRYATSAVSGRVTADGRPGEPPEIDACGAGGVAEEGKRHHRDQASRQQQCDSAVGDSPLEPREAPAEQCTQQRTADAAPERVGQERGEQPAADRQPQAWPEAVDEPRGRRHDLAGVEDDRVGDHQPQQQRESTRAERADIDPQGIEMSVQDEADGVTQLRHRQDQRDHRHRGRDARRQVGPRRWRGRPSRVGRRRAHQRRSLASRHPNLVNALGPRISDSRH